VGAVVRGFVGAFAALASPTTVERLRSTEAPSHIA